MGTGWITRASPRSFTKRSAHSRIRPPVWASFLGMWLQRASRLPDYSSPIRLQSARTPEGKNETGEHGVGGLTSLCFGRSQDRETIKTCLRYSRLYGPKDLNLKMRFSPASTTRNQ